MPIANSLTARVAEILDELARCGRMIFYSDLAARLGLAPITVWKIHPLCGAFDVIDQEDGTNRRPFRTVLVVLKEKDKQRPGNGFYEAVVKYRHHPPARSDAEKWELFATESRAVYDYAKATSAGLQRA